MSTRAQDLLEKLDFKVINVEMDDASSGVDTPEGQRALALQLAVELLKMRSDAQAADAVAAASDFLRWLTASSAAVPNPNSLPKPRAAS